MTAGRIKIEIVKGDIASQDVDAIVNAANNYLWMGAGVAGAIKRAGGEEIEREAVSKGPIGVGDAVHTSAGRLKAKYVIHAAVMGQDLSTDEQKIENATRSSIRIAIKLGIRSIAFPALGTGVGGFPLNKAAEIMIEASLGEPDIQNSALSLIRFVLYGDEAYNAFKKAAEQVELQSELKE
ncbi:MAG: macro domain-containing protein [Thermoplasmata archaeon]|nr:macro domain-containing protein [Thermoplasmata archaeon]